jgi:hypothetical protein
MSASTTSLLNPTATYLQYLMKDVKPRLFAQMDQIDPATTAFHQFILNAEVIEKKEGVFHITPITFTRKVLLCCLKAKDDDRKLYALLRKEFNESRHQVKNMRPDEAKKFKEVQKTFTKRYENNKAYITAIKYKDALDRAGNWIERAQKEIFKELLDFFLHCGEEKRISGIKVDIDYVKLDDLDTDITFNSELVLDDNCNHCHQLITTAHKLHRCAICAKVFYCNEQCANNDSGEHKNTCTTEDRN